MKQKNDAGRIRRRRVDTVEAKPSILQVNLEGEWMESDALRKRLLSIKDDTTLDLAGLTHVDAASFQVLVSATQSEAFANGKLRLVNVSEHVRHCFQYAGAEILLAGSGEIR